MTRVSIMAFDLFPWRQSRMKLAKTLQMGQTPSWVKWTHLDACTQFCTNRPEVPSFRLNWPANNSSNQDKSILVDSEEVAQHPLCVLPVCACTVRQNGFWPVSCDTDSITIHIIPHYQPTIWLPWSSLAFGRVRLVCFTLCFSFLIKPLAESRGMSDLMRSLLCFGTFIDCKNATQQERERRQQKLAPLCACGADML